MVLCDRFPALSPFSVRRERFSDVIGLYGDLKHEAEKAEMKKVNGEQKPPDGSFMLNGTLYKPAQNDDWF